MMTDRAIPAKAALLRFIRAVCERAAAAQAVLVDHAQRLYA